MEWLTFWAVVAALLLTDMLIHWIFGLIALPIFERKPPFGVRPFAPDPLAEPISFLNEDGQTLRGSLYLQPDNRSRGVVLFCPETDGSHWSAMSYCRGAWEAGFSLLAFDFRGQGESDSMPGYVPLHWVTHHELDDIQAAMEYIQQREEIADLPLMLMGISRGGGAALLAASQSSKVRGVVVEGAFSNTGLMMHYTVRWAKFYLPAWVLPWLPVWHLRMTLACTRWLSERKRKCRYVRFARYLPLLRSTPVLLITGKNDTYVHPDNSRLLQQTIGGSECKLWLVDKAKHNTARQIDPETYDATTGQFLTSLTSAPVTETESTITQQLEASIK